MPNRSTPRTVKKVERLTPASFRSFYKREYRGVLAILVSLLPDVSTAEDVAQDAFVKAYQQWDELLAHPNPAGWIRRVAINNAYEVYRRSGRESRAYERHGIVDGAVEDELDDFTWVWQLVRDLPKRQMQAVVLYYVSELSVDETAAEIGVSSGTIKSHLHAAREKLRGAARRGGHYPTVVAAGTARLMSSDPFRLSAEAARELVARRPIPPLLVGTTSIAKLALLKWVGAVAATVTIAAGGYWWMAPDDALTQQDDVTVATTEVEQTAEPAPLVLVTTETEPDATLVAQSTTLPTVATLLPDGVVAPPSLESVPPTDPESADPEPPVNPPTPKPNVPTTTVPTAINWGSVGYTSPLTVAQHGDITRIATESFSHGVVTGVLTAPVEALDLNGDSLPELVLHTSQATIVGAMTDTVFVALVTTEPEAFPSMQCAVAPSGQVYWLDETDDQSSVGWYADGRAQTTELVATGVDPNLAFESSSVSFAPCSDLTEEVPTEFTVADSAEEPPPRLVFGA